jgi:hypothetical protein
MNVMDSKRFYSIMGERGLDSNPHNSIMHSKKKPGGIPPGFLFLNQG